MRVDAFVDGKLQFGQQIRLDDDRRHRAVRQADVVDSGHIGDGLEQPLID